MKDTGTTSGTVQGHRSRVRLENIVGRAITTQAVASAGQFVRAREPGPSKGPRRSETAQAVASARQFESIREPGSSKGPRRSETGQAVASAGKFVTARKPGSSKDSRRAKSAQATSTAVRVVRARSIRVEYRLEACEECTSCNIGGTGSVRQEYRPSLTESGCVFTRPVRRVHQLPLPVHR